MRGIIRYRHISIIALLVLLTSTLGGTQAASGQSKTRAGGTLTVFAAASLQQAFTIIGTQFDIKYGARVTFNFGGSDTLANQIIQGAPADVFASANTAQMNVASAKGVISGKSSVFVHNRLVLIVPRSNPGHVYSLPDLGRPGLKLVLAAPTVPVGNYARKAFAVMATDEAFGSDFLSRIKANTVSNETDVTAVTTKIALGEGDAGVVYVTDVTPKVAPQVLEIPIPPAFNQVATYPIAVVKGSQNATLAQQFVNYVLSPAGQAVLTAQGFITTKPAGGYSAQIQVSGLISKTMTLAVADLEKMPATTVTVTQRTDTTVLGTHQFTGVLLNTVLQVAGPVPNPSFKNDLLRQFVTVGATDGYQVSVSMGEISSMFGRQPIILAYQEDGKPLAHADGAVELIVPGDYLAGRDVRNVDKIVVGTPVGTP